MSILSKKLPINLTVEAISYPKAGIENQMNIKNIKSIETDPIDFDLETDPIDFLLSQAPYVKR